MKQGRARRNAKPAGLSPERFEELQRIARAAAKRVWGKVANARFNHSMDKEDLVSAAWESILRALPRHDGRPYDSWLYRRALGGVMDALRVMDPLARTDRARRKRNGEASVVTDALHDVSEMLVRRFAGSDDIDREQAGVQEDRHTVALALEGLGERDRYVLHRRFYDDATYLQISEELGCTESNIARIHKAALSRLKNELARHGHTEDTGE